MCKKKGIRLGVALKVNGNKTCKTYMARSTAALDSIKYFENQSTEVMDKCNSIKKKPKSESGKHDCEIHFSECVFDLWIISRLTKNAATF